MLMYMCAVYILNTHAYTHACMQEMPALVSALMTALTLGFCTRAKSGRMYFFGADCLDGRCDLPRPSPFG